MRQVEEVHRRTETALQAGGLDLVIPFTTPALTQAALNAANRLGAGLNATIRLLKIQQVPYPLDLREPPVPVGFIEEQLRHFRSKLPARAEIRLARDFEQGLTGALSPDSVVLLATRKRPWRTNTERLAARLRNAGYKVLTISDKEDPHHA